MKKVTLFCLLTTLFLAFSFAVFAEGEKITNGSFETPNAAGTAPSGFWTPCTWGETIFWDTESPKDGSRCVKMSGYDPYMVWSISNAEGGAEYEVSAWLKRISVSDDKGPYIKFEFYKGSTGVGNMDSQSFLQATSEGVWSQVKTSVVVPKEADTLKLLFRLSGTGTVYWDSVSCRMSKPAPAFTVETGVFCYDGENTDVLVDINTDKVPAGSGYKMRLSVRDESNTYWTETKPQEKDEMKFSFSSRVLPKAGVKYVVECRYLRADDTEISSAQGTICRFPKPSSLNGKGEIVKDGEVFTPVIPYHLNVETDLQKVKAAGANVITSAIGCGPEQHLDTLNAAQREGLGCFVALYRDMKPAGDPANLQNTIDTVTLVKDHPALLGYFVMDEPFLHEAHPIVEEKLAKSYETIHSIDTEHPVLLMETYYDKAVFHLAAKYCDIMMVDPYPAAKTNLGHYTETVVEAAKKACKYKKAVYSVVQAFEWQGYLPTGEDVRYQVYASLFSGANGFGYFKFRDWTAPYMHLWDYTDRNGMWTGITHFAAYEQKEAMDVFLHEKYPVLQFVRGDDLSYILYAKNGKLYLIALNHTNANLKKTIPLTDYRGMVTVGAYEAQSVDRTGLPDVKGNGSFALELTALSMVKYEIKTKDTYDYSKVRPLSFRDLGAHQTAREAIEYVTENGIMQPVMQDTFCPTETVSAAELSVALQQILGKDIAFVQDEILTRKEMIVLIDSVLENRERAAFLENEWRRMVDGVSAEQNITRAELAETLYTLLTAETAEYHAWTDGLCDFLLSEICNPTGIKTENGYVASGGKYIVALGSAQVDKSGVSLRVLHGRTEDVRFGGQSVVISCDKEELTALAVSDAYFTGLYGEDGICHREDAVGTYTFRGKGYMGIYNRINGKKELLALHVSGDIVTVHKGQETGFYIWENMRPTEE